MTVLHILQRCNLPGIAMTDCRQDGGFFFAIYVRMFPDGYQAENYCHPKNVNCHQADSIKKKGSVFLMKNPRELVLETLEFSDPDRITRQIWLLPWAQNHYPQQAAYLLERYSDDIVHAPGYCKTPLKTQGDMYAIGTYVDEWGCEFINRQEGIIGEVKRPLIENWSDLVNIRVPKERLTINPDEINAFCNSTDKFVLSSTGVRPFEQIQFLRGTENVMIDLAAREEHLLNLIDTCHSFYSEELELWAKTDVDGLFFMDDWGTQQSLLISPDQWRQIFKPLYKDYVDIAHRYGKKIFMHSDGYILDIFPDLIEIGLDAINSQLFCMEMDKLRAFAGKITFWGEIDRQYLLCQGTPEQVRAAVFEVYKNLYCNGGVIGQVDFGVGAKPENVEAALAAWEEISRSELDDHYKI